MRIGSLVFRALTYIDAQLLLPFGGMRLVNPMMEFAECELMTSSSESKRLFASLAVSRFAFRGSEACQLLRGCNLIFHRPEYPVAEVFPEREKVPAKKRSFTSF